MYYDYWDYGYGTQFLMPKADARVTYREGGTADKRCYDCRYYQFGACALVEGVIEASYVCDLYTAPPEIFPRATDSEGAMAACELTTIAAKGRPWRMFTEMTNPISATEPPEWIPLMPIPGLYRHPSYGDINITSERNARFVENFNGGVYQTQVAVDAEHMSKLSGAVAWMDNLRQNSDGSVDAHIKEWTSRGQTFMEEDAFKYVSPEWYDFWEDPATGQVYADIICGAALTTQPFFKEKALRPLVASEGRLSAGGMRVRAEGAAAEQRTDRTVQFREMSRLPQRAQEEPVSVNPNPPKGNVPQNLPTTTGTPGGDPVPAGIENRFAEMERRFTEQQAELATARTANETLTTQLQQANERTGALEAEGRRRRFTDLAMGHGGATDGHAWVGNAEDHVVVLEALAATEATEDGPFQRYVRTQRAAAEQAHTNSRLANAPQATTLTSEVGSAVLSRTAGSARSEADGLVKTMREQDPKLSMAAAEQALWEANPELFGRVRQEEQRLARERSR
jgi:hypothetical protein